MPHVKELPEGSVDHVRSLLSTCAPPLLGDARCDVLFLDEVGPAAMTELRQCVEGGQGIGMLTAPPGTGKTLFCLKFLADSGTHFQAVYLGTCHFPTTRALMQALLYELGRPYAGRDDQELRLELMTAAKACRSQGRGLLLVLDEAHLLEDRLLEDIRTLADQSLQGAPLVRVILSGQLDLEELLTSPSLEALNQRIACQISLEPLSREETIDYIAFRLQWAGCTRSDLFAPDALELIARAGDGLPRSINHLCDHCLTLAFVSDAAQVTSTIVKEALSDLKQLPCHWNVSVLPDMLQDSAAEREEARESFPMAPAHDSADALPAPLDSVAEASSFEVGADFDEPLIEVDEEVAQEVEESFEDESFEDGADLLPEPERPVLPYEPSRFETPAAHRQKRAAEWPAEEEPVFDRYAALDAGRAPPEGCDLQPPARRFGIHTPAAHDPTREPHAAHEQGMEAGEQPLMAPWLHASPNRPDRLIDSVLPLLEMAQQIAAGGEMASFETDGPPDEFAPDAEQAAAETPPLDELDADSRLTGSPADADSLEARIGELVLDTCLQTQRLIDQGLAAEPVRNEASFLDLPPAIWQPLAFDSSQRVTRFDTVQPEPQQDRQEQSSDPRDIEPAPSVVPRPNYRLIFSTLRRRQMQQRRA